MDKKDVIEFFDRCAATWDADMIKSDAIIGKILDNAVVGADMDILDGACGTGVMFETELFSVFYLITKYIIEFYVNY